MKQGDKVRFVEPDDDERGVIFSVLEDREDRVLVTADKLFEDWKIKPTAVYLKTDLELVTDDALRTHSVL
ncbi:MAG: hypothetical protein WKF92_09850 [Pyrinomonadaceae bacterium]